MHFIITIVFSLPFILDTIYSSYNNSVEAITQSEQSIATNRMRREQQRRFVRTNNVFFCDNDEFQDWIIISNCDFNQSFFIIFFSLFFLSSVLSRGRKLIINSCLISTISQLTNYLSFDFLESSIFDDAYIRSRLRYLESYYLSF